MLGHPLTEPEVFPPLSPDWRRIIVLWFLRQEQADARWRRVADELRAA